ncbi:MAG: MBL fold metallo-hydrolase [Thermoanaerobaculia bacterium]
MHRETWAVTAIALATCAAVHAQPRVEPVGPGIFAVLQPDASRFDESNSTVVVLGDSLLVVDSQSSLAATRATIAAIRARSELPVGWLVLTHWHGDHVQGASLYRETWPDVRIVGHRTLAVDVPGRAEPALDEDTETWATAIEEAEDRLARGVDREGAPLDAERGALLAGQIEDARERVAAMRALPRPFPLPDVEVEEETAFEADGRSVRLLHRPGHTRGDLVVWIPDAGVLASGDLIDDLPFGGHGVPSAWIESLRTLRELPVRTVVPGHGAVHRGDGHLERELALFESLVDQVRRAVAEGADLATTQERVDLEALRRSWVGEDEVAARTWDAFIPATIERAWLEARGELAD